MRSLRQTRLLNRSRLDALGAFGKVDSDWPSEVLTFLPLRLLVGPVLGLVRLARDHNTGWGGVCYIR